jgi:hypothetical protein
MRLELEMTIYGDGQPYTIPTVHQVQTRYDSHTYVLRSTSDVHLWHVDLHGWQEDPDEPPVHGPIHDTWWPVRSTVRWNGSQIGPASPGLILMRPSDAPSMVWFPNWCQPSETWDPPAGWALMIRTLDIHRET